MTANLSRKRIAGVTLIELMVAMVIGSFLMIGAVTVFTQSRTTFRVNESVGRLQENGRFVLDVLEPDLRMTSYFGLTTRANKIDNRATPIQPVPPGLGVVGDCGQNWTINLIEEVGGANNGYNWLGCAPFGAAQPLADTLVIRRASEDPIGLLTPGTMYIQSARFRNGLIFVGNVIPPGFLPPPQSQPHLLMVSGYYVSQNSSLDTPGNPVPSLRVKTLQGGLLGPTIIDQEVLPGVEDFQVQLGVDTDLIGAPTRGSINRYVNPGDPILNPLDPNFLPDAVVLSIRVWIRLRAERPEQGFVDTTNYVYADQNVPALNDQFRRTVVSKTIYLRNTRPAS